MTLEDIRHGDEHYMKDARYIEIMYGRVLQEENERLFQQLLQEDIYGQEVLLKKISENEQKIERAEAIFENWVVGFQLIVMRFMQRHFTDKEKQNEMIRIGNAKVKAFLKTYPLMEMDNLRTEVDKVLMDLL